MWVRLDQERGDVLDLPQLLQCLRGDTAHALVGLAVAVLAAGVAEARHEFDVLRLLDDLQLAARDRVLDQLVVLLEPRDVGQPHALKVPHALEALHGMVGLVQIMLDRLLRWRWGRRRRQRRGALCRSRSHSHSSLSISFFGRRQNPEAVAVALLEAAPAHHLRVHERSPIHELQPCLLLIVQRNGIAVPWHRLGVHALGGVAVILTQLQGALGDAHHRDAADERVVGQRGASMARRARRVPRTGEREAHALLDKGRHATRSVATAVTATAAAAAAVATAAIAGPLLDRLRARGHCRRLAHQLVGGMPLLVKVEPPSRGPRRAEAAAVDAPVARKEHLHVREVLLAEEYLEGHLEPRRVGDLLRVDVAVLVERAKLLAHAVGGLVRVLRSRLALGPLLGGVEEGADGHHAHGQPLRLLRRLRRHPQEEEEQRRAAAAQLEGDLLLPPGDGQPHELLPGLRIELGRPAPRLLDQIDAAVDGRLDAQPHVGGGHLHGATAAGEHTHGRGEPRLQRGVLDRRGLVQRLG